jgi:hypothetical protein
MALRLKEVDDERFVTQPERYSASTFAFH